MRRTMLLLAALATCAIAVLAVSLSTGGGESEEFDADRAAGAHVGSPANYKTAAGAPIALAPTAGWVGEAQLASEDTWEPHIAADPSAPYVYAMYNRYSPACGSSCPNPAMMLRVSSDGGANWGTERLICTCNVKGQYDPVLAVAGSTGAVVATWMNWNTIMFSRSIDHGTTWSTPVAISGKSWADKPWIGVSASGVDVYIAYESRSVLYLTSSHNSGTTWSTPKAVNSDSSVYRYPNGLAVLPNGTAVLAASKYPGGSKQTTGAVDIDVWRTTNGGTTWTRTVVDTVYTGVDFNSSSTSTIAGDAGGTLVIEYTGATALGANGRVFTRRSTDGGATWSARTEHANGIADASFPAIASRGTGDFRITWMDRRGGSWNVWYRASGDGGVTFAAEQDIADASTGATYKSSAGFASPYGDYSGVAITSAGKAITVSGEGASFGGGPGGIWTNREN